MASAEACPGRRQLGLLAGYGAFYNPLELLLGPLRRRRGHLAAMDVGLQVVGLAGLVPTALAALRWALAPRRGPVTRSARASLSRIEGMSPDSAAESSLALAARAVDEAEALVITAGAGMGVDSGLPDFRGPEGFWNAYPAFRELGLRFEQLANPEWFFDDPALAWGFYGHRLNLYRLTVPHEGFATLLRWAAEKPLGAFVFTSNVDGQFQKAGFPENRIVECHGSIHYLQCLRGCGEPIRSAKGVRVEVDEVTCRAQKPFPSCPSCRGLARPNILMFGDMGWDDARTDAQHATLGNWLEALKGPVVVLEFGAGTNVPTVRMFSERAARAPRRTLVRINPREPQLGTGIALPLGALEAIRGIESRR